MRGFTNVASTGRYRHPASRDTCASMHIGCAGATAAQGCAKVAAVNDGQLPEAERLLFGRLGSPGF